MIELLNVTKRFDKVEAVRGVSLQVGREEFVTLLGPSGSGKSTTLMMVAGHEMPDDGTITIDGRDVTYLPAHRRGIGMVFQAHYVRLSQYGATNIGVTTVILLAASHFRRSLREQL